MRAMRIRPEPIRRAPRHVEAPYNSQIDWIARVVSESGCPMSPDEAPELQRERLLRVGRFALTYKARVVSFDDFDGRCFGCLFHKGCVAPGYGWDDEPICIGQLDRRWFDHASVWTSPATTLIVGQPYVTVDTKTGYSDEPEWSESLIELYSHLEPLGLTFELKAELSWWYPGWTTAVVVGKAAEERCA